MRAAAALSTQSAEKRRQRANLQARLEARRAKKEMVDTDGRPLSPAEIAHKRHFFRIGDGFEGTASDWTEYVVWLIGVCGVFFYMANPNARRNLHAMEDDEPTRAPSSWSLSRRFGAG